MERIVYEQNTIFEVTYKTASYLNDASKSAKQRAVQDDTIGSQSSQLRGLYKTLTNSDNNHLFIGKFSKPTAAIVDRPEVTCQSVSTQNSLTDNDINNLIFIQAPSKDSNAKLHKVNQEKPLR